MGEDSKRATRRTALALSAAHLSGAIFVFVYSSAFAPADNPTNSSIVVDVLVFVAYAVIAFPVTGAWCERLAHRALAWVIEGREPTDDERVQTLTLPRRMALVTGAPWAIASVFFAFTTAIGGHTAVRVTIVFFTILDGGLVSCTIGFLLMERLCRPAIAMALAGGQPVLHGMVGVRLRLLATWALGSGVPLAGLLVLPLARHG